MVRAYLDALKSGDEGAALDYWAYAVVPQRKLINVRGYEIVDTRRNGLSDIYVRARIISSTESGSRMNRLWEFYMYRESTTGEWKIQDINMASG